MYCTYISERHMYTLVYVQCRHFKRKKIRFRKQFSTNSTELNFLFLGNPIRRLTSLNSCILLKRKKAFTDISVKIDQYHTSTL